MSVRLILAASAALAVAAPAFAQDASASNPPPAAQTNPEAAAALEAEGQALEAKGEAFEARMEAMTAEMTAAVAAAPGDQARLNTDLDVIVAKYQPDADAFAVELETFFQSAAFPEGQRAQMRQMALMITAQVKGAPAQAKAAALEGGTAPETAAPASAAPRP